MKFNFKYSWTQSKSETHLVNYSFLQIKFLHWTSLPPALCQQQVVGGGDPCRSWSRGWLHSPHSASAPAHFTRQYLPAIRLWLRVLHSPGWWHHWPHTHSPDLWGEQTRPPLAPVIKELCFVSTWWSIGVGRKLWANSPPVRVCSNVNILSSVSHFWNNGNKG